MTTDASTQYEVIFPINTNKSILEIGYHLILEKLSLFSKLIIVAIYYKLTSDHSTDLLSTLGDYFYQEMDRILAGEWLLDVAILWLESKIEKIIRERFF